MFFSAHIYFSVHKIIFQCTNIFFGAQKLFFSAQIYFSVHKYISSAQIRFKVHEYVTVHKYVFQYTNIFSSAQMYFSVHKYVFQCTNIFSSAQIYFNVFDGGQVTIVFPRLTCFHFASQRPSQPALEGFLIPYWKACFVHKVNSCPGGFCCCVKLDSSYQIAKIAEIIESNKQGALEKQLDPGR